MLVCIVDTETTGLSKEDLIIELAAILYDTQQKSMVSAYSYLFQSSSNPVEHINGLSPGFLMGRGYGQEYVGQLWQGILNSGPVEYVLAHNASFDRRFLDKYYKTDIPWVCTQKGLKYSCRGQSMKLCDLLAAHNIPITGAHRALNDILPIVDLLNQVPDLENQLAGSGKPPIKVLGSVPFEQNILAKEAGFYWSKGDKAWAYDFRGTDEQLSEFMTGLKFQVRAVRP